MATEDRTALDSALATADQGTKATANECLGLAEKLQGELTRLQDAMRTEAPVDLAKLIQRARTATSFAPAALLELTSNAERVVPGAARGTSVATPWAISATGGEQVVEVQFDVLSPWPDLSARCRVEQAGDDVGTLLAHLRFPQEPPRPLIPYLLRARGEAGGEPFTLAVPVDLVAGKPLEVAVLPERVFRGGERRLNLTVSNRLGFGGAVTLKFGPPPKVKIDPEETQIDLPPGGSAKLSVTAVLEPLVSLGELRIPFQVAGEDARFQTTDSILVVVAESVPQARIKRAAQRPTIDGELTDAAWQDPPTIPQLARLANGDPVTEQTAVWVTYDDSGLYFAYRNDESQMDKLVARFTERGAPLYQDDDVEVFLHPAGSKRTYQFAVNPLGTRGDDSGNSSDWLAAAAQAEGVWAVEVFIPFSAIGMTGPPAEGVPLGMQVGRQQKARKETSSWAPGKAFRSVESFGEVLFE